ncbi:uncharacterized protein LOC123670240 [Melitaea cinxia]|uniref:uncharacterized protein LOC123670240 n=1 Tax=Melitaea cinxia TaxID=113334 RepID=UPI001E26FB2C|nr:uncharacterized protein LOC123670240 [Melitaea cinxia]
MILHVGLVFLFLTCAKTTKDVYNGAGSAENLDSVRSNLPSNRYIAKLSQLRKREADLSPKINNENSDIKTHLENTDSSIQNVDQARNLQNVTSKNGTTANKKEEALPNGLSEGTIGKVNVNSEPVLLPQPSAQPAKKVENNVQKNETMTLKDNNSKLNETQVLPKTNSTVTNSTIHATATEAESAMDLDNPGVVKRGLIVFGGFSLLAIAYFIFYRKKNKKYDGGNIHNASDANQFRYGVLQSDDRRDNLELSRIPLTMESDEDEDEDLEIFDLEQKKKSLSYVNLQTNDEDIVLHSSKDESKNNLLLDIEDGTSDTLINWSSSGNKSIL